MDVPSWQPSTAFQPALACAGGQALALLSLSSPITHPYAYIMAITLFSCVAFYSAKAFSPYSGLNDMFATFQLIGLAHVYYVHFSLSATDALVSASHRNWRFAYKVLYNLRSDPNTFGQHVSSTSNALYDNLETAHDIHGNSRHIQVSVPSDRITLRRRAWTVVGKYALLCIYFDPFMDPGRPALNSELWRDYDHNVDSRSMSCFIWQSTSLCNSRTAFIHAWFLRIYSLSPIATEYLTLSALYDVFAMLAVCIQLDHFENWPPMFGSIKAAVTVREFWSSFWHRLIYNSFSAFARRLSAACGFQTKTQATRCIKNAFVFITSGLMHWLVEYNMRGGSCRGSRQLVYYTAQVFAIVVEGLFQIAFKSVESWVMNDAVKMHRLWSALKHGFGYVWVACWLIYAQEMATNLTHHLCTTETKMYLESQRSHVEL